MTTLIYNMSQFFIEEDLTDVEYIKISSNSKYYKEFASWLRDDVFQYDRRNPIHNITMNILTEIFEYPGNSDYPHKKSMSNFLEKYLPITIFKLEKRAQDNTYRLIPIKRSENNKLITESLVKDL